MITGVCLSKHHCYYCWWYYCLCCEHKWYLKLCSLLSRDDFQAIGRPTIWKTYSRSTKSDQTEPHRFKEENAIGLNLGLDSPKLPILLFFAWWMIKRQKISLIYVEGGVHLCHPLMQNTLVNKQCPGSFVVGKLLFYYYLILLAAFIHYTVQVFNFKVYLVNKLLAQLYFCPTNFTFRLKDLWEPFLSSDPKLLIGNVYCILLQQ